MPTRKIPASLVLLLVLLVQGGAILPSTNLCVMPGGCDRAVMASQAAADCHRDATLANSAADCCGNACMASPSMPLLSRIAAPEAARPQVAVIAIHPLYPLAVSAVTPTRFLAQTARGRPAIHLVLHSLLI